ncbi:RagB/SusD family nutrient uptake outer membrane protein [Membranihabitans maritimus]|uniref:RagB/SusD family nutrient uptake outer membrane protein n=1 Tax=Membranihabitans maritimus TaxID=2904244 RepID=UPI001F3E90FE|nr:RagB/SusD family nutrient uptake outer membrane protein [Membranihabitans maritimus]
MKAFDIKKIPFLYLILIFVLLGTGSCSDDFLNRSPKGTIFSGSLANESGVNGLLIGAYSLLNESGTGGTGWHMGRWIFGGVASDDAHTGTEAGALQPVPEFESYTATSATRGLNDRWRVYYAAVQRCNDVLRLLQITEDNNSISPESAQQIRAEARFLRGVYHLYIALMWKNIPFVDETVSASTGNYYVSNTENAWPRIEEDFEYASNNLTETKADAGRANKWAAKCFLVKSYMFQNKHSDAKPLLDDIIQNGVTPGGLKYDLNEHFFDNFNPDTKNGPEQVFAVMHSVNDGANGQNGTRNSGEGNSGPYGGPFTTYGFYQPSFSLVNSYKTDAETGLPFISSFNDSDVKHDLNILSSEPFEPYSGSLDSRLDWTVGRRGIPYLDWGVNPGLAWVRQQSVAGPYLHIKHVSFQSQPQAMEVRSTSNTYNLIRFADVLLWAAEVEVELGNLEKAEEYVNRVRMRAANPDTWVKKYIDNNDPLAGFSNEPAANYKVGLYSGHFLENGQDFAREAVRFERKLELGMEHHRFFDLQRYDNGTGYMAEVLNEYIEHETSIPDYNFYYMEGATFTQGKNEIYPIPIEQIDLSVKDGEPTLIQNSGY